MMQPKRPGVKQRRINTLVGQCMAAAGLFGLALVFAGCDSNDKSSRPTPQGMGATMTGVGDGDGNTTLTATFFTVENGVTSPIRLDLSAEQDRIIGSFNDIRQDMQESPQGSLWVYTTEFNDNESTAQFRIDLMNATTGFSAPNSFVVLPPGSSFTSPQPEDSFPADNTISLTWDNSGLSAPLTLRSVGQCDTGQSTEYVRTGVTDSGSFQVLADDLAGNPTRAGLTRCALTVSIERSRDGQLDSEYTGGGDVTGSQVRDVPVTVTY